MANSDGEDAGKEARREAYNDLFLAFIAATGTELDTIQQNLAELLDNVGYSLIPIRLSSPLKAWKSIKEDDQFEMIKQSMDAGDELRERLAKDDFSTFGGKHAVALLGLGQVREQRSKDSASGQAFLFRSLKTPEEVWALRELYGRSFYAIAVFSELDKRAKRLSSRLAARKNRESDSAYLISRDETDSSNPFGQNVRDTFSLGDVFINVDQLSSAKKELERFLELIFGNTFRTPTRSEYCMFHAQGAAFRSADLGRQVGAVISSTDGEILAVGTNEVPKYGGGQFWAEDETEPDPRDFIRERDWNDEKKRELIRDLLERLTKLEHTPLPMEESAVNKLLDGLFSTRPDKALRGALAMDIIGFYRSVHAETAAIIDAARRGVSVKDCTMYVTAFPCHECARHVLASGIKIVRYIEPYPKSLAADQYPDSIEVTSTGASGTKLLFEPFVGIAPWQYMNLFAKNKRKQKDGTVVKWRASKSKLRYGRPLDFFGKVEHNWCDRLSDLIDIGGKTQ